ncbi:HPF/RaiA family ribosome-associated protein [bacterium]|nr:HPF/RaiA family ribosome-associated protein [bacterium]
MPKINVTHTNADLDDDLQDTIHRKLSFALDCFDENIRDVNVIVSDVNGPRGGIDKKISIRVRLMPRGNIVLTDQTSNIYEGISHLAHAVKENIGQRLRKSRDRIRKTELRNARALDA